MNLSAAHILRTTCTVVIACAALVLLSGCGAVDSAITSLTRDCPKRPITVDLRVDTSGSTKAFRVPGGEYERQVKSVLSEAAANCARVIASPIDGNSVSAPPVFDVTFSSKLKGNPAAAKADRLNQADGTLPAVRHLLNAKRVAGSDQLGALARAAQLATQKPSGSIYDVVVISDMAIKVPGSSGYSVYNRPLLTEDDRRAFIAQLDRLGELPDLSSVDGVWFGGVSVGISSRSVARGTLALVPDLATAMNGRVRFAGPNLTFSLGEQDSR